MVKLQKSIEKRAALLKATLCLINHEGIQGASMAKVAKMAKASPATIYLYFENKQDMVNQLYLEVKTAFAEKTFEEYKAEAPVKKNFERIWFNMSQFKLNQPEEASFLSQCDNTPMIDEQTQQEGLKYLQPLFDLWKQGQEEEIIKPISPYLLYAFTIYPMAFLMNMQKRDAYQVDKKALEEAFQAAWDSIKV
ncbi:TetR/AcrR family transcriptional regulator [Carboxylicivirga sp. N1Y90]|uniref:TetR/AcrR family transcriptional regulator n=1 Tax=Carboxylicivirga fragile TaxID=3417571 RepID=UPI003D34B433|nr:TetR/AcrR family transcriptional regulator [Marinilabiliaceae bacterium N1Y90]